MSRKDYVLPWNYKLGRFFFKRKNDSREKKEVFHLKDVRTIGFLFDASQSIESFYAIKELIDLFEGRQHVLREKHILAYCEYGNLERRFHMGQFNKRDFNFFGIPKSGSIKEFINNRFNLLIDYSNGENPYIESVLNLSRAEFKVGNRWEENSEKENLNFIINVRHSGIDSFNPSIINYLSSTNE